jgi:hypothetical protein
MNKLNILYGVLIGMITTLIGSYLFIEIFTENSFIVGIKIMKMNNNLGKIITLGAILNLVVFYILLKLNREDFAKGVILALILQTLTTLFV